MTYPQKRFRQIIDYFNFLGSQGRHAGTASDKSKSKKTGLSATA
jgi:hypothetical protein